MSCQYNGLQARIKALNEKAKYVPCGGHSLNLVGLKAAKYCFDWCIFWSTVSLTMSVTVSSRVRPSATISNVILSTFSPTFIQLLFISFHQLSSQSHLPKNLLTFSKEHNHLISKKNNNKLVTNMFAFSVQNKSFLKEILMGNVKYDKKTSGG